MAAKKN